MPFERPVSLIQELRLRQWARRNYVEPDCRRDADWHPVVLDEMQRRDRELAESMAAEPVVALADIVPLHDAAEQYILRFDERCTTSSPNTPVPARSNLYGARRSGAARQ